MQAPSSQLHLSNQPVDMGAVLAWAPGTWPLRLALAKAVAPPGENDVAAAAVRSISTCQQGATWETSSRTRSSLCGLELSEPSVMSTTRMCAVVYATPLAIFALARRLDPYFDRHFGFRKVYQAGLPGLSSSISRCA